MKPNNTPGSTARILCGVSGLLILALSWAPALAGGDKPDGKKLFNDRGCVACHNIGGPSVGPGPELTQVAYQRDAAWLRAWISDPQKIKKDTIMPKTAFKSPDEVGILVDYLLSAKRPIPAADSADGQKLFADYTCSACHGIKKKGGKPQFPDLYDESKVHDAEWLERWLKNPQEVKKGTFMATFPLTTTQRHALVQYVLSLNKKK
jgi:nitric oxide reductase subunit C